MLVILHPTFSPITEFVILFTVPALFWYALLLYPRSSGRPSPKAVALAGGVLLWTALMYAVVKYNIDRPLIGDFPARTLIYFVVPVTLALVFRRWLTCQPLSQHLLVSLQLFRCIGLVFVLEWWRGVLPAIFAQPAGWGDVLTSLIAAWILIRYWNTVIPRQALIFLAVVGLADFASAFFFGFASAPTPAQLFAFDLPNRVDEYPTGLIPVLLVPFAVVGHILSLSQLPREK